MAAIDWTIAVKRIGDRTKSLADGTMCRIEAGRERYGNSDPLLIPIDRLKYWASKSARPLSAPLSTPA